MSEPQLVPVDVDRMRPLARILALLEKDRVGLPSGWLERTHQFPRAPQRILRPDKVAVGILEGTADRAEAERLAAAHACRLADLWETFELYLAQPKAFRASGTPLVVLDDPVLFPPHDLRLPTFLCGAKRMRLALLDRYDPAAARFPVVRL